MNKTQKILITIFTITFLLLILFLNSRPMPDEGHYLSYALYAGRGETPYKDYFDHHGIGMTIMYQIIAEKINFNQARLLIILLNSINACIIFLISKKIYDYKTAILSTAYFQTFIPILGGYWVINETPMLFLLLTTIYLIINYKTQIMILTAGITSAIIPLYKQTFIWFFIPIIIYLWIKKRNIKEYLIGIITIITLFLIYILLTNDINIVYEHTITYNLENIKLLTRMLNLKELIICLIMAIPIISYLWLTRKQLMATRKQLMATKTQRTIQAIAILSLLNLYPFAGLSRLIVYLGVIAIPIGHILKETYKNSKKVFCIIIILMLTTTILFIGLYALKDDFKDLNNIATKIEKYKQPIFVYPAVPELYFITKKEHASRYLWVWPWNSQNKYQTEIINNLKNRQHLFIYFKTEKEDEPNKITQYIKTHCKQIEKIKLKKLLYNTFKNATIYQCNKKKEQKK